MLFLSLVLAGHHELHVFFGPWGFFFLSRFHYTSPVCSYSKGSRASQTQIKSPVIVLCHCTLLSRDDRHLQSSSCGAQSHYKLHISLCLGFPNVDVMCYNSPQWINQSAAPGITVCVLYVSQINHQSLQEFYPPGLQLNPHQLIFIVILCIFNLLHILLGEKKRNTKNPTSFSLTTFSSIGLLQLAIRMFIFKQQLLTLEMLLNHHLHFLVSWC